MAYQHPDTVLMIFCKAPVAGQVKTRLMTEFSANQALQAHIELSLRTINLVTANHLCAIELWCAPTTGHEFFTQATQDHAVTLQLQQGIDLGERMHHALCTALNRYRKAILIGCDCPSLTPEDLQEAINSLDDEIPCVLAPAEDGGYTLLGLNKPCPELFNDMPWGTDQVLSLTRERLAKLTRHHELKTQWDVDTPEDWARYKNLVSVELSSPPN